MDNYEKKPKEPVQPDVVEIPNNAPDDWEDADNIRPDPWAELWGDAE